MVNDSKTLSFPNGWGYDTIWIQPGDNEIFTGDKTFNITLTANSEEYSFGALSSTVVNIKDNEHPLNLVLGDFVETDIYHELGGFDVSLSISAMYDVLLKMVLDQKISYSCLPIVTAVYKGGGVSSIMKQERQEDQTQIRKRYFSFYERLLYGAVSWCMVWSGRILRYTVLKVLNSEMQARFNGY